ncbi:MAG: terminase family protein, partial [Clostridia bacterium]
MKDIVVKIKKIEAEQERRKKLKLYNYNSGEIVHTKQLAFHKCAKKNRWVFGGNRSGKTECGAVEAVWLSRGIHPYRKNKPNTIGWVVSVSQQVQRDVAQQKLLSYIDPSWIIDVVMISGSKGSMANGIIDTITMRNVFGGESKIAFKSCEAGREKFQGASLDFVWFDEEPPQDIYEECKMRVFDRDGDVFGTMTPLKGLTWVYDKIYINSASDCEVWYEFMEWNDNPYLSKKEIKHLTDTMSEENLQSRRYGRFTSGNGLVYPEFDENIHIIEPFCVPTEWQSGLS